MPGFCGQVREVSVRFPKHCLEATGFTMNNRYFAAIACMTAYDGPWHKLVQLSSARGHLENAAKVVGTVLCFDFGEPWRDHQKYEIRQHIMFMTGASSSSITDAYIHLIRRGATQWNCLCNIVKKKEGETKQTGASGTPRTGDGGQASSSGAAPPGPSSPTVERHHHLVGTADGGKARDGKWSTSEKKEELRANDSEESTSSSESDGSGSSTDSTHADISSELSGGYASDSSDESDMESSNGTDSNVVSDKEATVHVFH